jgi:hypothetical protein
MMEPWVREGLVDSILDAPARPTLPEWIRERELLRLARYFDTGDFKREDDYDLRPTHPKP